MNTIDMLEDLGHSGLVSGNSRQRGAGAAQERSLSPIVVITDQVMPHMSGLRLAEAIKSEWPDLPVIVATWLCRLAAWWCVSEFQRLSKP